VDAGGPAVLRGLVGAGDGRRHLLRPAGSGHGTRAGAHDDDHDDHGRADDDHDDHGRAQQGHDDHDDHDRRSHNDNDDNRVGWRQRCGRYDNGGDGQYASFSA
jgi:hypothetical protein